MEVQDDSVSRFIFSTYQFQRAEPGHPPATRQLRLQDLTLTSTGNKRLILKTPMHGPNSA